MGTVAVRVVCVGGGGVCHHFIFFLYTLTFFFVFFRRDTGMFSPCRRNVTLYVWGMESRLSPFFITAFFAAILAFFPLVGVMCSLFEGNGICSFSFVVTYSALHIHH